MYAQYLKESWDRDYMEWPWGFVSYEINPKGNNLHIWDVYIMPSERNKGHYGEIVAYLTKECTDNGVSLITGNVFRSLFNMEQSLMAQLKQGAKVIYSDEHKITLAKEIK